MDPGSVGDGESSQRWGESWRAKRESTLTSLATGRKAPERTTLVITPRHVMSTPPNRPSRM